MGEPRIPLRAVRMPWVHLRTLLLWGFFACAALAWVHLLNDPLPRYVSLPCDSMLFLGGCQFLWFQARTTVGWMVIGPTRAVLFNLFGRPIGLVHREAPHTVVALGPPPLRMTRWDWGCSLAWAITPAVAAGLLAGFGGNAT